MPWLVEKKSGIFHIGFRFRGEEITRSLKTRVERTAQAILHRVEETIDLVERGRLEVPTDADVGSFLLSDGKTCKPTVAPVKRIKAGELFDRYNESLPDDAIAAESLRFAGIHMRHVTLISPHRTGEERTARTSVVRGKNGRVTDE